MWTYQYKHGDRPLDGYTIQRAAGRGGFGEVYYAVSDGGREIALKVITGYEQIELRGIGHCMNLKSPHLVTIFDVKQNAEGRSFVLMEFVSGPNLRELLDAAPSGLGTQKAAFFLREIAKGLSYLHECGIVHRDLKPANIFFENGYAKIGDYGLSKAIEPTHHSGQTVTVGTVHYMAPEVGCGKYDRSIDIYALGALLYEMLTGIVPFVGASAGEILIKHLSHEADCSGIPEPFCTVIRKAMAKDPANRYATVQEMVEAVFGAEHVRNSVSQFSPQDLTMVAGRVAGGIHVGVAPRSGLADVAVGGSSVTSPNGLGSPPPGFAPMGRPTLNPPPLPFASVNAPAPAAGGRLGGESPSASPRRFSDSLFAPFEDTVPPVDPYSLRHRLFLGAVATLVVAISSQAFNTARHETAAWMVTFAGIIGASLGVLVTARNWLPKPKPGHRWADRFALAGAGAIAALVFAAPIWLDSAEQQAYVGPTFFSLLFSFALADPRRWSRADRAQRIGFGDAAVAGAIAFASSAVAGGNAVQAIAIAGGAALVVQVLMPWDERAAGARKAAAQAAGRDVDDDEDEPVPANGFFARVPGPPPVVAAPVGAWNGSAFATPVFARPAYASTAAMNLRPVPRVLTAIWFCAMIGFAVTGTILNVIAGASSMSTNDFASLIAAALAMYVLAIFCFRRMRRPAFRSWAEYLILPGVRVVCLGGMVVPWTLAAVGQMGGDEDACVVIGTVFAMLWVLTWAVPWLWRAMVPPAATAPGAPWPLPPLPVPPLNGAPATPAAPRAPMAKGIDGVVNGVVAAVDSAAATTRDAFQTAFSGTGPGGLPRLGKLPRLGRLPRVPRAPRDLLGGLAAFASAVLLLVGFMVSLLLAADVPGMIAHGVPDRSLSQAIARDVFSNSVADWPALVCRLAFVVAGAVFVGALIALLVSRRRSGGTHMLRAAIGVGVLALSFVPFGQEIASRDPWRKLASRPAPSPVWWSTLEALLDCLRTPGVLVFLILFVSSVVLLVWPRRQPSPPAAREEVPV